MRGLISFVLFLTDRYYSGRKLWVSISFVCAKLAFTTIDIVTLVPVFNILGKPDFMNWVFSGSRLEQDYKEFAFPMLPGYLSLSLFFKKDEIKSHKYSDRTIWLGNGILVMYLFSLAVTIFLMAIANHPLAGFGPK
jgi:hypothetical protein